MLFVPNGAPIPNDNNGPIKQTPDDYLKQFRVEGTLQVKIPFAYNLIASDSGLMGNKSDPFVKFTPAGSTKKEYKYFWIFYKKNRTEVKKDTLDPQWNASFDCLINCDKNNGAFLKFDVYDSDSGMSDDKLGSVNIKIGDLFTETKKWLLDDEYTLEVPSDMSKKHSTAGKIYVW